jgi:hypothetical protein
MRVEVVDAWAAGGYLRERVGQRAAAGPVPMMTTS